VFCVAELNMHVFVAPFDAGTSKINLEDMSINELAELVKGLQAKKDITPEDQQLISHAKEVFGEKLKTATYSMAPDRDLMIWRGGMPPDSRSRSGQAAEKLYEMVRGLLGKQTEDATREDQARGKPCNRDLTVVY
jgi:hypothetical protein